MKSINILSIDNLNILNEFLNYKKLLESDLKLDKELSFEEYIKKLNLEKQVFIYKQNYTITYNKVKINNEEILFYTADDCPQEGIDLFLSLIEKIDTSKLKKANIFEGEDNILEKDYYFIFNNDFYY